MSAFLSDANSELICLYQVVQSQLEELIEKLAKLQQQHCEKFYYEQRAKHVRRKVDRAARLLYLNKTCFNGLYRVNSHGQFNVPIGRYKNPAILQEERLRQAHVALQGVDLSCQDFESALRAPQAGDLVYLDPPYEPLNATSNFTSYTSGHFGAEQQRRLAELFRDLVARGCKVILSNSDAPLIRELYAEFPSYEILAPRFINSKKDGRAPIVERLILGNLEEPDAVALGSLLSQSSGDSPLPKRTGRSRPRQGRVDVVLQN
jgi:DNA adenine methylase